MTKEKAWDELEHWLEVERTRRMVVGSDIKLKMDELLKAEEPK
jgi:hypothetical protein